ncbi:TPA: hypothetical protein EYN23_18995 [Candidatus Poribacteria bacterium]|nr:hypothetical protein [Candidatus Poribacteria bacterium]
MHLPCQVSKLAREEVVVLNKQGWRCSCLDQEVPCKHIIACQWTLHCHQTVPQY